MATASKTTATITDERLIGISHYNYSDDGVTTTWERWDSARYFYSGERRSWFNFNQMFYYGTASNYRNYLWIDWPIGAANAWGYRDQDFKPDILADSSHNYGATDTIFTTISQVFDVADNIKDYEVQCNTRVLRNFNSSNRSTTIKYLNYNGVGWDTSGQRDVDYSGNSVISDTTVDYSLSAWPAKYKNVYTYDGTGKLTVVDEFWYDSGAWHPFSRYVFDYYSTGK